MEAYKEKLKEFEALLGQTDAESNKKRTEIVEWLKQNADDNARKAVEEMVSKHLKETDKIVNSIRKQLGTTYDLLPISYIARHYFGKSASWLYQRLNGYRVRGQVYTLNEEQKHIFNKACHDISQKIGSIRFA